MQIEAVVKVPIVGVGGQGTMGACCIIEESK